ncbi:hypothetical protein DPEC_G00027480 [Dallia pectoralis]|uniref:Uncharacterized protein n=1 Tax=Dallia pectoralis TaxID=75939 RepID=A0ACC2HHS3_DALPE|nr:hypothetical protein DPEC_G00027480 [Dallia pectoralis]
MLLGSASVPTILLGSGQHLTTPWCLTQLVRETASSPSDGGLQVRRSMPNFGACDPPHPTLHVEVGSPRALTVGRQEGRGYQQQGAGRPFGTH